MVFVDSSVLVNVPSGDSVTVFSVDLTVPLLLTLLVLLWETSWAHPTSSSDNGKADSRPAPYRHAIYNQLFHRILLRFTHAAMLPDARQRTFSAESRPSNISRRLCRFDTYGQIDKAEGGAVASLYNPSEVQ